MIMLKLASAFDLPNKKRPPLSLGMVCVCGCTALYQLVNHTLRSLLLLLHCTGTPHRAVM